MLFLPFSLILQYFLYNLKVGWITRVRSPFLAERIFEENEQRLPLQKPKNTVWTLDTIHPSLFCHFHFCWIYTYLVNVLQFVNNLTDHWLRALHFQLMEVELIFHSISCCLLAVSGKHEGKEKVCHKRVPSKVQVDCIWHQWSSWPQALFSLPTHGMTAWYKGRPLQIESICSREHSTVNKYSFNILFS